MTGTEAIVGGVVVGGVAVNAGIVGSMALINMGSWFYNKCLDVWYYRIRFSEIDAQIIVKAILIAIHNRSSKLKRKLNIMVGGTAPYVCFAPFPGESVSMGNGVYVQTLSDGYNLRGFDVWYAWYSKKSTYKWLNEVFKCIPDLTHPYSSLDSDPNSVRAKYKETELSETTHPFLSDNVK